MLFELTAYEAIAEQATRLNTARKRSVNLWQHAWDDRADAISTACSEAKRYDTPESWRRICELAVELRTEMTKTDGHEAAYFTALVVLTDLIEKSMVHARANPQALIAQNELANVREAVVKTRQEIDAEYHRTPASQSGKLSRLEASDEKFKQTVVNINILSDLKINISNIRVVIGGTAKKASDSVIEKAAKIVNLVREGVKLLNDEALSTPVRRAADKAWIATREFASITVRRFRALKLPEPNFHIGDVPPRNRIPISTYPPDGEQTRWIEPGAGRDNSQVFCDIEGGPEMVVVPAGKFTMGSPDDEPERFPDEGPLHEVTFARLFAVGRHAVTRGQFAAFVKATGHKMDEGWRNPGFRQDDSHPVVCVGWDDARTYASWLAEATGRPYRLLTECMVRPCVARGFFIDLLALRSCINVSGL